MLFKKASLFDFEKKILPNTMVFMDIKECVYRDYLPKIKAINHYHCQKPQYALVPTV
jgi:hypothetical protein